MYTELLTIEDLVQLPVKELTRLEYQLPGEHLKNAAVLYYIKKWPFSVHLGDIFLLKKGGI
jgi:hypothetical protein